MPVPSRMHAVVIDRFGSTEELRLRDVPVPEAGPGEVLIRVEAAGVGVWDPVEREGGITEGEARFPRVLGSDGAGTVAALGPGADRFREGDRVYAWGYLNPKGGFYAEYAAIPQDTVALAPGALSMEEAGAMPVDAVTALRGLDDTLGLRGGESLLVLGAGGGIGHLATQLAKRMGARVLAVASGEDGVALAWQLGADAAVEGRHGAVAGAIRAFAPGGLDAVFATAGGGSLDAALAAVRDGGRVAYPEGIGPEPQARPGIEVEGYVATADRQVLEKLNSLIAAGPFTVHVARSFPLGQATEAHRALDDHYLGKLVLTPERFHPG